MTILTEAERCLKCKKPQCSAHCPVNTPIPEVMNLFLEGKILEAGKILFENNPMSAITSIVCPHETNCAGHCILGKKGESVSFYEIERYVSSLYLDAVHLTPPPSNGIRVAVIGAGPAGITMSIKLALNGFKVTLIEANEKIGGVLRYGIPEFRLSNTIVDKYARILYELGIKFKPNTFIGSVVTIDDMLTDGYKALFISVGTAKPRTLGLRGETLGNVFYAIDYLKSPETYKLGKNVLVIGGGNVAMDAARMVVRSSPDSKVTVISYYSPEDRACSENEYEMAKVDGVNFIWQLATLRITDENIICARVNCTVDENGKKTYEEDMNDIVTVPSDDIIIAIGQGPQAAVLSESMVVRNDKGLVHVGPDGATNKPGIFAAGDIVTGPKTVIEAVAFTNHVAEYLMAYCLGEQHREQ